MTGRRGADSEIARVEDDGGLRLEPQRGARTSQLVPSYSRYCSLV